MANLSQRCHWGEIVMLVLVSGLPNVDPKTTRSAMVGVAREMVLAGASHGVDATRSSLIVLPCTMTFLGMLEAIATVIAIPVFE